MSDRNLWLRIETLRRHQTGVVLLLQESGGNLLRPRGRGIGGMTSRFGLSYGKT